MCPQLPQCPVYFLIKRKYTSWDHASCLAFSLGWWMTRIAVMSHSAVVLVCFRNLVLFYWKFSSSSFHFWSLRFHFLFFFFTYVSHICFSLTWAWAMAYQIGVIRCRKVGQSLTTTTTFPLSVVTTPKVSLSITRFLAELFSSFS